RGGGVGPAGRRLARAAPRRLGPGAGRPVPGQGPWLRSAAALPRPQAAPARGGPLQLHPRPGARACRAGRRRRRVRQDLRDGRTGGVLPGAQPRRSAAVGRRRMFDRLTILRDKSRASLWHIPALMLLGAVALFALARRVDAGGLDADFLRAWW